MADWKQITARIRRARSGKDPAGQLTNLFSKTRDAMVAFELARYFEASGNSADAGRWYLTAAERFRRSDWKTKAQDSATRLGATEPAEIPAPAPRAEKPGEEVAATAAAEIEAEAEAPPAVESEEQREKVGVPSASPAIPARAPQGHRRGRGRRGDNRDQRGQRRSGHSAVGREQHREPEARPEPRPESVETPRELRVAERETDSAPSLRGKYGDPGLSSRLTGLEMNFRRLLACSPTKLEDAAKAPAGPGVWVLTDSDLTTYYYVEACQTLRVAIPNVLRASVARRGDSIAIKPALAKYLEIPEARVAKYLSDHCVVRWLQMDDDAAYFAHFLVAVLRPALNQ
jgi:hypothetical protein